MIRIQRCTFVPAVASTVPASERENVSGRHGLCGEPFIKEGNSNMSHKGDTRDNLAADYSFSPGGH